MKPSCADKSFIANILHVEDYASAKNCRSYAEAADLVLRCSEQLKATLSPEQMDIYRRELENRSEAEEMLKQYYLSAGLKMYSHITEITDDPSAVIDALYND